MNPNTNLLWDVYLSRLMTLGAPPSSVPSRVVMLWVHHILGAATVARKKEWRATVFSSTCSRSFVRACTLSYGVVLSWYSVGLAEVSESAVHLCEFLSLLPRFGLQPLCV